MRPERRVEYEEPPDGEDLDDLVPRVEPPESPVSELSTAAERAAARRRLDRLAEEL